MPVELSISNSEIQTWKDCRRRWYLQYYICMTQPATSPVGATWLGTRVHAALEGYYGALADPVRTLREIYKLDMAEYPDYTDALMDEQTLSEAMVDGYRQWVQDEGVDQTIEVVGVEREILVPFPAIPGVTLRARLDMTVYDKHLGALMFFDHKTCQSFLTEDYLTRDEQAKFYAMLQRLDNPKGKHCMGGVFNMLRKVKRGPKAKPPFYMRTHVEFNNAEMNSMYYRTFETISEIIKARERLDAGERMQQVCYPHPTKDCSWKCPLASGACSMMDDGSDWKGHLQENFIKLDPYSRYTDDSYLDKLDQEGKL